MGMQRTAGTIKSMIGMLFVRQESLVATGLSFTARETWVSNATQPSLTNRVTWGRELTSLSGRYFTYSIREAPLTLQGCCGGVKEAFVKPFAGSTVNIP